ELCAMLLDDDARWRPVRRAGRDGCPDFACDFDVVSRMDTVRLGCDDRAAVVGGFANLRIERDLAEKRNAASFGLQPRAAVPEDRRDMVASRAAEARHVFDQSQDRYVNFLKH